MEKNSAQYFGHWMSVRLFMGKRLLAQWINEPLYNKLEIEKRLDGVEELTKNPEKIEELDTLLDNLSDISRLSSKLSNGTISPKELFSHKEYFKYYRKI